MNETLQSSLTTLVYVASASLVLVDVFILDRIIEYAVRFSWDDDAREKRLKELSKPQNLPKNLPPKY